MDDEIPYVDAHLHLHEFKEEEIERFLSSRVLLIAVAEDYNSSIRTLEIRDSHPEGIKACVGIHPWNIKDEEALRREIEAIEELIPEADCIGEVGLDLKFTADTYPLQEKAFQAFLEFSRRYEKPLNIHSAGAWRETLQLLRAWSVKRAIFHWYTGPLDLLREIISSGLLVSINASLKVQRKARQVVLATPLQSMLTESDGPYNYRGLNLNPLLIPELVAEIAGLKNVTEGQLRRVIFENFKALWERKV
ncbi:TatD family hydrolase [Infirmifilum lucidum]|uniref:TatD family hydrolase n=1 Tax=Infirmifilum lucidum TaxID=2776706 RepID=A0A7L9FF69_9CREN|nr:TatD family hydrolase [Infirmifilum lucidum]QOJ78420.1 TatD family hydrolase [Infirmifilum lucidum]